MPAEIDVVHEHFKKTAAASMPAVRRFAKYLNGQGYETQVKEVTICDTREESVKHGDTEDIMARKLGGNYEWRRFEVKGRTLVFTGRDDYPFDTIFVDRASKTTPKADWYVTISKDLAYAAIVDGKTHADWKVENIFDKTKQIWTKVYTYPKEHARFIKLGASNAD